AWLTLPWVNNSRHIAFDDVDPDGAGTRVTSRGDFVEQSPNRMLEGAPVKACQRRAHCAGQRPGGTGHEAHPTKLPALAGKAMEGMQHVCGGEACVARCVRQPAAVQQGLPFPTQADLHEGTAQMGTHDGVRRRRIDDCYVRYMAGRERFTVLGAHGQHLGALTQYMGFSMDVRP